MSYSHLVESVKLGGYHQLQLEHETTTFAYPSTELFESQNSGRSCVNGGKEQ